MTKELVFSSNIGQHDLDTKSKQIQQWIEKKYHVRVTIKRRKDAEQSEEETVSESKRLQGRRLADTERKLQRNWKVYHAQRLGFLVSNWV